MKTLLSIIVVSLAFVACNCDIYIDESFPYEDGPLAVSQRVFTPALPSLPGNIPPMHSRVFYPDEDDNSTAVDVYGVLYMVTGFGGIGPPGMYRDFLGRIASHGYVAVGSWPIVTGEGICGIDMTADAHLANIEYLKENLPLRIRNKLNWDYLALGCHSAGCGPSFRMIARDPTKYKALVNVEPVSGAIFDGISFSLPVLNLGAELANTTGGCSNPNRDFSVWQREWTCPKYMMEVADVDHCGVLDPLGWEACRVLELCTVGNVTLVPQYRTFLQGVVSAFLNTYVQGTGAMLDYVTNTDLIPMELKQHEYEDDCGNEASSNTLGETGDNQGGSRRKPINLMNVLLPRN